MHTYISRILSGLYLYNSRFCLGPQTHQLVFMRPTYTSAGFYDAYICQPDLITPTYTSAGVYWIYVNISRI